MAANPLPILLAVGAAYFLMRGKKNGDGKDEVAADEYVAGSVETGERETSSHKYWWSVGELADGSGWKWIAHQYDLNDEPVDRDSGVVGNKILATLAAWRMVAEWTFLEWTEGSPEPEGEAPGYVSGTLEMDTLKEGEHGYVWTVGQRDMTPTRWRWVLEQYRGPVLEKRADSDEIGKALNAYPSSRENALSGMTDLRDQWRAQAGS